MTRTRAGFAGCVILGGRTHVRSVRDARRPAGVVRARPVERRYQCARAPERRAQSYSKHMDAAEASTLSRVELEPIMRRDAELGDVASAEVIRAELESRTWQNVNPYAAGTWTAWPVPDDTARNTRR